MSKTNFPQIFFYGFKLGRGVAESARNIDENWGKAMLVNQECKHGSGNSDLIMNCSVPPPDLTVTSSILSIVFCYIIVFIISFTGNFTMFLILCR
uniref:Transmembrane protein n=1 Tax=Angiostrongylus cantonensis TaxID=6313 RepID=A0A0K0DE70_ANGCA